MTTFGKWTRSKTTLVDGQLHLAAQLPGKGDSSSRNLSSRLFLHARPGIKSEKSQMAVWVRIPSKAALSTDTL